MTDPGIPGEVADDPSHETVSPAVPVSYPVQAALGVLLGFAGGFFVKQGLLTQSELAALVPAVLTLGVVGWRWWAGHRVGSKLVRVATNPENKAVSLQP